MQFNLATFVKYLKDANFILATFFLILFSIFVVNGTPNKAQAAFTAASVNFPVTNTLTGATANLVATGISDNLSAEGVYTVTYRISNPAGQTVMFPLIGSIHRCVEGNGHTSLDGLRSPVCEQVDAPYNSYNVSLNAGNNFTQDVVLNTVQTVPMACGSFQSDIFSNTPTPNANGFFYASVKFTGVNCPEPTPTPTPTPTPSVTPTPTPTPSMTPHPTPTSMPQAQCPMNWFEKIFGSTIVCIAQNQEQNQAQIQNNNQNQDVNQNVTATGGSSSSSSSSSSNTDVKINN